TCSAPPCTGSTPCISRTSGIASTRRLPTGRSGNICGSSNLGTGPKRLALLTMSMLSPATSTSRSAKLSVRGVGKRYDLGNRMIVEAVRDVSFEVTEGEICALLGPSGCGKSTVLRMVAGLEDPSIGAMFLDGKEIHGPDKSRGMVFQRYTSFDWMTVQRNVEYGMRINGVPKAERQKNAERFIQLVKLTKFKDAYPRELSGGMQQRVAQTRTARK